MNLTSNNICLNSTTYNRSIETTEVSIRYLNVEVYYARYCVDMYKYDFKENKIVLKGDDQSQGNILVVNIYFSEQYR